MYYSYTFKEIIVWWLENNELTRTHCVEICPVRYLFLFAQIKAIIYQEVESFFKSIQKAFKNAKKRYQLLFTMHSSLSLPL